MSVCALKMRTWPMRSSMTVGWGGRADEACRPGNRKEAQRRCAWASHDLYMLIDTVRGFRRERAEIKTGENSWQAR